MLTRRDEPQGVRTCYDLRRGINVAQHLRERPSGRAAAPSARSAPRRRLPTAVSPDVRVPEARHDSPCFRLRSLSDALTLRSTCTLTSYERSSSSSSRLAAKANRRRGRVRLQAKDNACASSFALVASGEKPASSRGSTVHVRRRGPTTRSTPRSQAHNSTRISTQQRRGTAFRAFCLQSERPFGPFCEGK